MEAQAAEPTWLQVQGSAASCYFLPLGERLLNRFTSTRRWTRAFTKEETIVGFLAATTSSGQDKGVLARPVMLAEAATWLRQMGKTAVQMAVPEGREQLAAQLKRAGWVKCQSWLRLVKWLK